MCARDGLRHDIHYDDNIVGNNIYIHGYNDVDVQFYDDVYIHVFDVYGSGTGAHDDVYVHGFSYDDELHVGDYDDEFHVRDYDDEFHVRDYDYNV